MLDTATIEAIATGNHADPFSVLGMHEAEGKLSVRVFLPNASNVDVIDSSTGRKVATLTALDERGVFAGPIPRRKNRFAYQLRVEWPWGSIEIEDAYRFPTFLGEWDVWMFAEGSQTRPYEKLGAHPTTMEGVAGTAFTVWAPNAQRVSVVGDFNYWDGRRHLMRLRRECGVWEIFLPGVMAGALYKFEVKTQEGHILLKSDPYARQAELRPGTASKVAALPAAVPSTQTRQAANALDAPVSIYEVHLGSWKRVPEEGQRWLNYRELADDLVPYAVDMGFTHLELLPITEHPFDGSWGYQPLGIYAPTARFGTPEDFRYFVETAHNAGLGVILDWVPAHFPSDSHGLAMFDGTHLYEHSDPREGFHRDWNTLIYNFGRNEVRNFLVSNALYWIERFGLDGLRVDAVASMLYRDYSRKEGEWIPNHLGGRENLEAMAFMRRMNEVVGVERPEAITMAEESTAFPAVSRPPSMGGLGFHYKWNMGWMHDTLHYMQLDPIYRQHHHHELTFSLMYAFTENFVLPLSHDEVVHGKGSLLARMPGDDWQRFANLRAYYGFMWGHPGKKLLFMGCEFAQAGEWNHEHSLDWHHLDDPKHAGIQHLVRDLNRMYKNYPALYQVDFEGQGFEWIAIDDHANSVYSFIRHDRTRQQSVIVVSNMTPVTRTDYVIGVPAEGTYGEILNTDDTQYGGSGVKNGVLIAQNGASHGQPCSLTLTVPPLATLFLTLVK